MKPKDPIWGLYDLVVVNGKTTAKCKDCSTSVSAKSDRLRTLKQKCSARLVTKPSQKRPLDIEPEETVSTY